METKSVLLVDAFADEPLGGVPIPVITDNATTPQLRAVASEFGASGAAALSDSGARFVESGQTDTVVEAAVASWVAGSKRDDALGDRLVVERDGTDREYAVEQDGEKVRVELPAASTEQVSVAFDRLGAVLGIDPAGLENVGSELPVARSAAFGGTLFVPVGFLDDVSDCEPDRESLTALLTETETRRVFAFTFDTLSRQTDLHARVFDPTATRCERATSGVATASCGQYLGQRDAFDGERESVRVECGRFIDRPATVEASLSAPVRVGGHGLVGLETTLTLPEDGEDDIIEL